MSPSSVERRRVAVSLGTAALGVHLAGSPRLAGLPVTLATVPIATGYVWGPAAGNAVARLATGEGRARSGLGLRRAGRPRYWLAPAVPTVLGGLPWLVVALALLGGGGLALRPGATRTLPVPDAATGDGPIGPDPIAGSEGVVEGRTRDGGGR